MEKHLTLSGTPGVGFTVEASQDNGIGLDDPKEFEINERNTVNVFQFIPPKDISKTQLDITVTSVLTLKKSFSYSYARPMSFICLVPFFLGGIFATWALYCFKEPHVNPFQSSDSPVSWGEVCTAMGDVIRNHWFAGGPKTFSYITCIVGCVLMVGAFQFVYADWYLMIQEGDRDHCYYNDFCYRVSSSDIPFNLMSSNFAYILHAFILALSVWYMEAEVLARCKKMDSEEHKRKFSFSIGYAFAWALFFEGLFSTLYHLCPSKITFQFDTAFMFVISGLIVVVMYNGIKIKNCQEDETNVGATNFFLVFIVPLYILNYLGSLNHSNEGLIPKAAWAVPLALWCFIIVNWVGYKLYFEDWKQCAVFNLKERKFKCIGLWIGVILAVGLLCWATIWCSLPDALLFTCIAESIIITMMKVCCRNRSEEKCECVCECKCDCECCSSGFECSRKCFLTWIYVLITVVILVSAVVIFEALPTTNKAETPEKSRNENKECILLGFFDYHDLWHILSSFALLMGAHLVMYASYTAPRNSADRSEGQDNDIGL